MKMLEWFVRSCVALLNKTLFVDLGVGKMLGLYQFSVGYSPSPLNFIFNSLSNFFCFNLKISISVFLHWVNFLFAFKQLTRRFKSALTSLFKFLIELLRYNWLVSPAKWLTFQIFLLDSGRLYIITIAEDLEQILEGHHNLQQQEQSHIHL